MEAMADCVREKTFPRNTSIKDVGHSFPFQSLMKESMWRSRLVMVPFGFCHTFQYPDNIGADFHQDSFYFLLSTDFNYRIIIHDPLFYHFMFNSMIFPRIWIEYKMGENLKPKHFEQIGITVTEHHLLNRPEQPCEEEEDYDFLKCVKTSQARMVGCRPPWDSWSPPTLPLCQTLDHLDQYEKIEDTFYQMILTTTGCRVPCIYKV